MDNDTVSAAFSLLALLAPIVAFARDGGDPVRAIADVERLMRSGATPGSDASAVLELALSRDMRIATARIVESAVDACVEDSELCGALCAVIMLLDPRAERTGA